MNQLLYNIAGGIAHQTQPEKRTTISEVIVCVKQNIKQNRNWFYFKFSVKSLSFKFNNFNTEKFKPTFEGWNRPFSHLFGFTSVFPSKFVAFHPQTVSESWRHWCRVSFSIVFLFLPHLRTLAQKKRSENCHCFVAKNIFPCANNGRSR